MSSLDYFAWFWREWAYPRQDPDEATERTRKQVRQSMRFETTSSSIGGGTTWNPPKEYAQAKKRRTDASKQHDDFAFQATLKKIEYVITSIADAARKKIGIKNPKAVTGIHKYWVGHGSEKRAITPEFVDSILPEEFKRRCIENPNRAYNLPSDVTRRIEKSILKLKSCAGMFYQGDIQQKVPKNFLSQSNKSEESKREGRIS